MFPWHFFLILTGQTTIEYYFYQAMHNVGNTTVNVVSMEQKKSWRSNSMEKEEEKEKEEGVGKANKRPMNCF
jgi:hypothetical protein